MWYSKSGRTNRLSLAALLAAISLLAVGAMPASAITYGEIDLVHVNVGALVINSINWGVIQWCSGTLVHPRVFLTAGHCTVDLLDFVNSMDDVWVSFSLNAYDKPIYRVESIVTHPDYWWGPTSDPHDVGVLILKRPVMKVAPATLAPVGFLYELEKQGLLKGAKFAVVGYGYNENFEEEVAFEVSYRKIAYSEFLSLHRAWLYMSQNPSTSDSGTCYGDSGGPTFWQQPDGSEVLVAITSWGDAMCRATGINYRLDTPSSDAFLASVLASFQA